ncbi:SIMPL domain-containing protein [Agromyces seonyuensis]|uniref:DUF541 domain-containing protein n=1 Tax=Agromyces seonyuensis TaxID=2662446 RepID=A0A6I4P0I5_9MICO|nr:SIMPL domain-containing protein [Agromyces seonyuensis]MWB98245.1 DUF541 domain-containing protein [Agromyces seonyuensis]
MPDPREVLISVDGRAHGRRPPTQGTVSVIVSVDGPDREPAVEAALRTHGALAAELRSLAVVADSPLIRWSAENVVVTADRPWNRDGERLALVYRASASLSATFSDFGALGEWLARAVVLDGVNVGGVDWALDERAYAELVEEVRRGAVADAVAKARVYADALELDSVMPVELSEDPHAGAVPMRLASAMAVGSGDGGTVPTLEPADVDVEARVELRFRAR